METHEKTRLLTGRCGDIRTCVRALVSEFYVTFEWYCCARTPRTRQHGVRRINQELTHLRTHCACTVSLHRIHNCDLARITMKKLCGFMCCVSHIRHERHEKCELLKICRLERHSFTTHVKQIIHTLLIRDKNFNSILVKQSQPIRCESLLGQIRDSVVLALDVQRFPRS